MKGKSFKKMREKAKLTQKEVGDSVGVSHVAVGKWESGETMPRAGLLPKLAKLYKCKITDFFISSAT